MTDSERRSKKQSRGGAGCLVALGVGAILIVLAGVALFVTPFSLLEKLTATDFLVLDTNTPSRKIESLFIGIDPFKKVENFAVRVHPLTATAFSSNTPVDGIDSTLIQQAKAALPLSLAPASSLYQIETLGSAAQLTLSLNIPDTAQLDLYGYNARLHRWLFIPGIVNTGQTNPNWGLSVVSFSDRETLPGLIGYFRLSKVIPLISITIEIGQTLAPKTGELVNIVHPAGLQPNAQGALQGVLPAGIDFGKSYAVVPVIRNFGNPLTPDVATLSTLLRSDSLTEAHITRLVEFATTKPYKGLAIDYRGLPHDMQPVFGTFISHLAERLHNANLTLTLVAPIGVVGFFSGTAASAADVIEVPDIAIQDQKDALEMLPVLFNRAKLQIGLSTQSIQQMGDTFKPISYAEAVAPLGSLTVQQVGAVLPGQPIEVHLNGTNARFNPGDMPSITYLDANGAVSSTVWLTTESTIRARLKQISDANMGGVLLTDLAAPGAAADMLSLVNTYKTGSITPESPSESLAIRWIAQQGGKVAVTAISALGTPFVFRPDDSANSAQISADLFSADGLHPTLGSVSVAVASATLTPSTTPIPSITPIPTSTPTPVPTKVPPTAKGALPPPVSGRVTPGSFELGGQVQDLNGGTQAAMRRAGMKWVKRQVQVNDGNGAGLITQAHGAGFKILLSVVGNRDSIVQGGFFDQYAGYVGSLAGAGADAIEVWNEMNIDREWPTGKIDPALYTQLLAKAFNAIKAAHGSTIVVSGALAPTGAEGAFGLSRVWNDDHYYAGMAAAGAGNYADCIGVHYNEGVVSPNQTSGDPRDSYPTRYFATMLNRAASSFGGKQVCFTELGYLSPEGYSSAPSGFEWGQNTSIAQQAAWLAQAAVKASGSGRVRLMIVFNVDFTFYGADPQAGYAMIRKGGGCPACDALGQVAR